MFFKKQGFPEEGEIVLCTVTSVSYHSVFVNLDEYKKPGMIHISEVSPGRIRNIRDFVKEGKKIVCLVLRINEERGHIDLSLRRVNEIDKRKKIEQIKKEQNAEKIIEVVASKLSIKGNELYEKISPMIMEKYSSFSAYFDEVVKDAERLQELDIPAKYIEALEETIKQRIKPPEVIVKSKLRLKSYAAKGIEIIKESLKKIEDMGRGSSNITYLGSGQYRIVVKAADYKEAEKKLKESTNTLENLKKQEVEIELVKE